MSLETVTVAVLIFAAGLLVGKVLGARWERQDWKAAAWRPLDPVCRQIDGATFFVFLARDFYEHWHNPLARARFERGGNK